MKLPIRWQKPGLESSTAIGIVATYYRHHQKAMELFMNDDQTDAIVMIGEIGGGMEAEAAYWIKETGNKKPVVGFIAGQTASRTSDGTRRSY